MSAPGPMTNKGESMKQVVAGFTLMMASMLTLAQETPPAAPATAQGPQRVRFDTSMGSFVVRLETERAPLTVENFLRYVRAGFYDGMIFHRVVENFVAQGGGVSADYKAKQPLYDSIANESGNGLENRRGTLGMARSEGAHSANCQFYFNLADNHELDPLPSRWGFAVFGEVIEGLDVIERIGHVPTGKVTELLPDAPLKPVVIEKVQLLE